MILANLGRQAFPCYGCPPCQCSRGLSAYGEEDMSASAGGDAAAGATTAARSQGASAGKSVALGVATGLLVWFLTRTLDGKFTRR